MTDWDRTVAEYGPTILRLACRILGHGPDAEDAVQDAFLQVYQIGQQEVVASRGGLLRRAVVHRSLDRLRRRRRRDCPDFRGPPGAHGCGSRGRENGTVPFSGVLPPDELPGREDDPQEIAAARELSDRLRDAVGHLPQQQAAAFCLRYFDDQSYEQIAASLGVAVGAVATALHKARAKLKTMLAPSMHEE